jgi:alpha-L-rhamnosidase
MGYEIMGDKSMKSENKNYIRLVDLRTNGLNTPLGIDSQTPLFSWRMDSNVIGQAQTAYQIIVSKISDPELSVQTQENSVVWDSGKQFSIISSEIPFGIAEGQAVALTAETRYSWIVTVWDMEGQPVQSESAYFETGLRDTRIEAWDGAQWIGPTDPSLNADTLIVYRINYTVQIPEGSSKSSVIFGANDFRMNNAALNEYRMEGENYYRYEVDISEVTASGGAKVNVYRVGHAAGDSAVVPYKILSAATVDDCNIDQIITNENKHAPHHIQLVCESSKVSMYIDGTAILVGVTEGHWTSLEPKAALQLNPRGLDNVQAYPLLNDIGFAAEACETAIITNYEITHYREPQAALFGEHTGATYAIFEDMEGVTVQGNSITVRGGETGILVYTDPSFGAIPMLRTELHAEKKIAKAKLYASSRGIHELYINGRRVGDEYFNPGSSEYSKTICYTAHDVTGLLKQGKNAIGAYLASGWWSDMMSFMEANTNFFGDQQSLLLKLVIQYEDGTAKTVVSHPDTWTYSNRGPIKYAGLFQGEKYDARDEETMAGWSEPNFDDSAWMRAAAITPLERYANPAIVSKPDTGVKVYEVLDSTYLSEFRDGSGTYLYDMGLNMVGIPRITLEGKAGQVIIIRTAEILYPDLTDYRTKDIHGMLMVENLREALSTDFYICKDGVQTIQPRFTYHGYRYLEISGTDGPLPAEAVKGVVLSSVENMSGAFESSNPLVDQLFLNIQRSQLGNFLSIPTDCPQRNERMGWGEAVVEFARTSSFNSSIKNFYENYMQILVDSQVTQELVDADIDVVGFGVKIAGMYPSYAPAYNASRSWGTPWSCVGVIVPWEVYKQYGSTGIIRDNFESMTTYMDAMETLVLPDCRYLAADGGICGDWLSLDKPPYEYTDASVYVYMLGCMAVMSEVIAEHARAKHYKELYAKAKAEWNIRFIDPKTGRMNHNSNESQSSYTIALYYDLLQDGYKQTAINYLVEKVEAGYNGVVYSITTGLFTTPMINLVLSQNGHSDVAYKMIENINYPSWLYSITQGATSMWERWDSYTVEDGFGGNNNMNSFNHFSLGGVGAWLYNFALGIDRDETAAGMQHFVLQPVAGGSFTYAKGQSESLYGMIKSGWRIEDNGMFAYEATVPANSTATLYLPIPTDSAIKVLTSGVKFIGTTRHNANAAAQFELASGGYAFTMNDSGIVVNAQAGYVESIGNK